ncbi:hypothetical protein FA13DRAFT_435508 [Coprinellus micaceus]|uniref:Uncharacterized protein n=1 Tax=Coprinellus micaceus TaxID=71717 RepID=A0A4Y7TZ06_COPMI|nr:hypothetical protein FA13DRAFT_435508 [Coprinellus micaceus]
MRVDVRVQRFHTGWNFLFPRTLPTNLEGSSCPSPIPAQEWRVQPPMLTAAMPVVAVIAMSPPLSRQWVIISRNSTDFPVPCRTQKNQCEQRATSYVQRTRQNR